MRFALSLPSVDLRPFVDRYWFAEASAAEAPAGAQFPTGGVAMLFSLGPPQALLDGPGGRATWFDTAWVSGERARPYHIAAPHGARLVGVGFRPGGARPFFDLPLAELTDRVVPLEALWPRALLEPLREALHAVDTSRGDGPVRLFALLDRGLRLRLDVARSVGLGLIGAAVRRLGLAGSGVSVGAVADDLGVSTRYLRRAFEDGVGLGPKTLHRVLRFQELIGRLDALTSAVSSAAEPDWSALALACGYFDQSHMIRDFRLFTEMRPSDYVGLRSLDPNFAGAAPASGA